ncbi:MAG: hypothetical protein HY567_01430 [Candidatus Kerfeldbacteria bacterium]|nr:hypothetical protein [Candidatus Kerfeldbacteria bacterium]
MKLITALLIALSLTVTAPRSIVAHETASPHEEITAVNAPPANTNSTTAERIAKLRAPAALKPLLLVPLALILYFVYERLAQRS